MKSSWSDIFEVIGSRGLVVSVRNPLNDALMRVHADRLIHVSPFLRFERGQEAEEIENEIPNLEIPIRI